MASFEKRGDFQWRAKVRRQGQPEISKTFETRRDAENWSREIERRLKRGEIDDLDPTRQKITIGEAIQSYSINVMPTLARGGKGTVSVYLRRIEAAFGSLFVSALRSPAIAEWTRSLTKNEALGNQTVVHHLNTLSSLINHAESDLGVYLPAGNPVRSIKRPSAPSGRDRILRDGELELLIRAARDNGVEPSNRGCSMLEAIIKLAIATGMRQGELLALRWSWIDQKQSVVKIPADTAKNGEGRSVALSSTAMGVLTELQQHNQDRVFFNWSGTYSFQSPWQRLLKRAKRLYIEECLESGAHPDTSMLENLRFHDLRHDATTKLFARGLNPFEVSSMTGHKTMSMLKRYTHTDAANLAQKLG